jgi:hypothetical protein
MNEKHSFDMTTTKYGSPKVGCYIDESAGSADDCNRRTIEFAEDYGFEAKFSGCFDGLRGLSLEMSLDDAESASRKGECFEDAKALCETPAIALQLDKIGADDIRSAVKETGGWSGDELSDDESNRVRVVWMAACDLKENASEQLSEIADDAVSFLNELETRSFMSWTFEDNSLFLLADVDSARDDVGFVSSKEQDCPADDYEGEWLHVSDPGNATLYVRASGKDREIWSLCDG